MTGHPLEALSALLDDELPPAERRAVEAHLAGCPACARRLRELSALDTLARALPPVAAPEGYQEALPGRVRERLRAHRPVARRAAWMLPLAAGIALAVLSPLVLRHRSASDMAPAERASLAVEPSAAPAPLATEPETRAKTTGRVDSAGAGDTGRVTPPPTALARDRAPRRESGNEPQAAFVAPPAAPAPAARANESDRASAESAAPEDAAADTFADAPQQVTATRDERVAVAGAAGHLQEQAASPSLKKADASRPGAVGLREKEEEAFRETSSRPASTAEEARAAREAWRRFVSEHPSGPRADEGRVRFVEAAGAVFRLTRDEGDRAIAERAAGAYLARPDAAQAARVREVLRGLEP